MAKRNNHKAARALAEWSLANFKYTHLPKVAQNHGITERTVENWLATLKTDEELSALFDAAKEDLLTRDWAAGIDSTLTEIVTRMRALAMESDSLPDLTMAFEKVADVALAKEILRHEYGPEEGGELSGGYSPSQEKAPTSRTVN